MRHIGGRLGCGCATYIKKTYIISEFIKLIKDEKWQF